MSKKNKSKELRAEIANAIAVQLEQVAGKYSFGSKKTSKNIARSAKKLAKKFASRVQERDTAPVKSAAPVVTEKVRTTRKPAVKRTTVIRKKAPSAARSTTPPKTKAAS